MRGTWPLPRPATNVTARPSCSASSGVIGCSLVTPRIPSVPKSLRSGAVAPSSTCRFFMARRGSVSHVHELQLDPQIERPDGSDGDLQIVPVFARHAHLAVLHRRLHLELCVLDGLHQGTRLVGLDAFL